MRRQPLLRLGLIAGMLVLAGLALVRTQFFASAQGNRINYGDTVSGAIDKADDVDTWLFDGLRDDIVLVRVARADGSLVPSISLTDSDGTLLVSLDWPEQGSSVAQFAVTLRKSGTHTLAVRSVGGATGAYSLSLTLQQAAGPASFEDGVTAYGRTVSGEITNTIFRQVWSFRGSPGDVIDVMMQATSGDLDAYLSLVTPDGNVLSSSDSGGIGRDADLLAVRLPSSGTYTLAARRSGGNLGESGTTQGAYTLTLALRAPGLEAAKVTPIVLPFDTEMRGRLNGDAPAAVYSIDASGVISLSLDMADPAQLGTITVMTSAQSLLGVFSGITPLRTSVVLPAAGTFWIEVSAPGMSQKTPVDFAFSVGKLVTATGTSRALQYGKPQKSSATLEAWHFAGRKGDLIQVSLLPFGPVLDGTFKIFAPGGTLLVQRTIENGLTQPLALGIDGLYEMLVEPRVTSGEYQVSVDLEGVGGRAFAQRAVPQEKGVLLPAGSTPISGELVPASSDAWIANISEAQTWLFELTQTGSDTPAALAIESPDGKTLGIGLTDPLTGTAQVQVFLSHAGRYRVIAFDPSGSTSCTYTLHGEPAEGGILSPDVAAKGVLTGTRPADTWQIEALPDTLLNVRLEMVTQSSPPTLEIFNPDGRLVASTTQSDQPSSPALMSVPVSRGGTFKILVAQPKDNPTLIYRITQNTISAYNTHPPIQTVSDVGVPEVFVAEATPLPAATRVDVASIIALPITPDSAFLTDARRVELETLIRGQIAPGSEYQAWTFAASSEQMLGFSVVALDDSIAPGIILLDKTTKVLAEKTPPDGWTNDLAYRFAATGFYTVVVRLDRGGRYTLWINNLSDVNENVSGVLSGRALGYGDTLLDEFTPSDEKHLLVFYGHADDTITVRANSILGNLRLGLSLAGVNGGVLSEVAANDAVMNADLPDFRLPEDGLYQIIVSTVSTTYGRFALHLDLKAAGGGIEHDGGLIEGQVLAGLSTEDAIHHWLFTGQSGERVTLKVEPLSPGGPTPLEVKLADSAGQVFVRQEARLGHGTVALNAVLLPRQGVYQVIISGGQRQGGLYRLTLQRDLSGTKGIEQALHYGETVGQVLSRTNYIDVWTLGGTAGDVVSIRARRVRGDMAPISLQLRTRDGLVLATAGNEGAGTGTRLEGITLPSSGHYSVIVGNPDQSFEGEMAYELTVDLESSPARSMGILTSYGQTVEGSFYVDDPADTWLFEGQAGEVVTISAQGQSPSVMPSLNLVSTDWHSASVNGQADVLASAQAIEGQPAQIEFTLPVSATYAVEVQDATRAGGNYELSMALKSRSLPAASLVRPDQAKSGEVGSLLADQVWAFAGTRNMAVTITVTPESRAELAPMVALSAPDGTVLARTEAPSGQIAQITGYLLALDGTYQITVSRALRSDGHTGGRYTLNLQQTGLTALPQPLTTYGKRQIGLLNATSAVEHWSFEGQQGDVVRIAAEGTSGDLDPVLRLYDSNGVLMMTNDDQQGPDAELRLALPQTGTYVVEVSRYGGMSGVTSGNYGLLIDLLYRPGTTAAEPLLVYGDRVVGTTDGTHLIANWSFNGVTGDEVYVDLQFALDDSPLILSLRDPAGNLLITGERDRGDSIIKSFTLPISGFYVLEVLRPGDAKAAYSPYSLALNLLNTSYQTPEQGGVLTLDHPVTGQFTEAPATHLWSFQAEAGQSMALSLTRLGGMLSGTVTLIAPDGSRVMTLGALPGSTNTLVTEPLRMPLGGVYTLLVAGDERALGLVYRLWLQPAAPVEWLAQELIPLQDGFGRIDDLQSQAGWSFVAQAGETLSLRVGTISGDLEPTLMLWGPDNRPLMQGLQEYRPDGSQASLSNVVAPLGGVYRVTVGRIGGVLGNTSGNYRLMLRQQHISSRAVQAVDVSFGMREAGILKSAEPKLYAFQGVAGDVIGLAVRVEGSTVPDVTLETETGVLVNVPVVKFKNEADITAFVLPADGRYVVALQSTEPVNYEFGIFRRESEVVQGSVVRNLGRGQAFVEAVQTSTQTTHWNFTGQAGEVLNFAVDTSQSGLRADITLYGPRGYIATITQPIGSYVTPLGPVRLPDDGDYQLVVGAWLGQAGDTSGAYSVRMQTAEAGVSGSEGGHIPVLGSVVTGGLISQDAQDAWTFDGQAGGVVTIRAEQKPGQGSLGLELLGPDSTTLAAGEPGTAYLGAEIPSVMLPLTGTYTVRVEGRISGDAPIEYRLAVVQTQSSLVASMAAARGIIYGSPQNGTFQAGEIHQAWVFFGQAGEQISDEVAPITETLVSTLYLIGPDGRVVLASTGLVPGSSVQFAHVILPQDGFYGLVVERGGELSGTADYTVTVKQAAAGALAQGTLQDEASGKLTGAALVHEWQLASAYSGDYLVQLQVLAPGERLDLYIVSADGRILTSGVVDAQGKVNALVRLENGQQVAAVVSGGPAIGQGQYLLHLLPASLFTGSGNIAVGLSNVGRIEDQHFTDEWRVQAPAGALVINVLRVSGDLVSFISVYDQSGSLIKQQLSGDGSTFEMKVQLPADGIYQILVSRADGGAGTTAGDYTITLKPGS